MEITEILNGKDNALKRALFAFTIQDSDALILKKFGLWMRWFFPQNQHEDAEFHPLIDAYNLATYRGTIKSFTDIAFRGAAKTTRTKRFIAFCIANDKDHFRRYIKILSEDLVNSRQIVTDVYNVFVDPRIKELYPEVFAKTATKREETMQAFTTSTGIKMVGGTVGMNQRGNLQDEARPDWIIFEDFETRKTLRSAVESEAIWQSMDEARTGLAKGGACIYNCNYISERGNVHKLVTKQDAQNVVMITPITKPDGTPSWHIYTPAQIEQIKKDAEDYEGDYMCNPAKSIDVYFDRDLLNKMVPSVPVREIAGVKIYVPYIPGHAYGLASDIGGGVGLDSSTICVIDFSVIPFKVVATLKSNTIKPDEWAYEIARVGDMYGICIAAPEQNNHGHATIAILKGVYENIYFKQMKDTRVEGGEPIAKEYGWHTNAATKPKMMTDLRTITHKGLIDLSDIDIINEAKSYSRNDLMDMVADPRLQTRHFDLLTACAICVQMKDFAEPTDTEPEPVVEEQPLYPSIGI